MTVREFHLQCRINEFPAFQRVLAALPLDRFDYTPHERSQSAARIIWTLVGESQACLSLIETGTLNFSAPPMASPPDQVAMFDQVYAELINKVAGMSEDDWNRSGQFLMNGQVVMEQSIGSFLWLFFFDAIHHRGQLSTYIRPMGGKVPSIYGPSGDAPAMRP